MGISISNLQKPSNNLWIYDYSYDNTYKDPIDNQFFDIVKYESNYYLLQKENKIVFQDCDFRSSSIYTDLLEPSFPCLKEMQINIVDAFKFSQRYYLHERGDYTFFSYNIYQDAIQINISFSGLLNGCEIETPEYSLVYDFLMSYLSNFLDDTVIGYYDKINNGELFELMFPNLNVPIIGDPFGKWSLTYKVNVIPKTFRHKIETDYVQDLTLTMAVDGAMLIGNGGASQKFPHVIDLGVIV